MDLLQFPPDRGYPVEYLLTRIRGRRSRLISEWKLLLLEPEVQDYLASSRYHGVIRDRSAESMWRNLVREYRWVASQMNDKVRSVFRPFFLYSELRTLFICLRNLKNGNQAGQGSLLEASLLSPVIKKILTGVRETAEAVRALEAPLAAFDARFSGISARLEETGLRGAEREITNTCLAAIIEGKLHPVMRGFFARLIDSRNLISMYKYVRLEQKKEIAMIPGGTVPERRIRETVAKENIFGICSLIRTAFGIRIDSPEPGKVETALYRAITRYLRKEGRDPFGAAPILDYLWRCSLEIMNLSILIAGGDLERDMVNAEVVVQ